MNFLCRRVFRIVSIVFVLSISVSIIRPGKPAQAQSGRTIKIIDPFPAGGTADILARLLAQQIGAAHGQNMIVENHPGASAAIGYELASRAPSDGNTILIAADSIVVNPLLKKSNYDAVKNFVPICYLASSPLVFVVDSSSPYHTIGDLIAAAHANPGKLTFAALGPATSRLIQFEQFKRATKVDMIFVPYPGGAPVVNALLSHQVTIGLVNYSEAVSQLKAGTLRALAAGSEARLQQLPNVPTVAESGYPGYKADVWFGIFAPAKTPENIVGNYSNWFAEALQAPEIEKKLLTLGLNTVGLCGVDYTTFILKQYEEYSRVIHDAHLRVE